MFRATTGVLQRNATNRGAACSSCKTKVKMANCYGSTRRFQSSYFPSNSSNAPVYGLIGMNVGVWGLWKMAEQDRKLMNIMTKHFTVSSRGVLNQGLLHTLFTSTISHYDGWHLFANCFTLYFFGGNILAALGLRKFMSLYVGGGIFASLSQVVWPFVTPRSWPAYLRGDKYSQALGASGSVSAVVATSVFMFPTQLIYVYGIFPVPAALFGLFYISKDLIGLFQGGSGVGNAAHLGGAAYGAAFLFMLKMRRRDRFR